MARNQFGDNFLELGFDWYIVERWNSATNESNLQQHLRLGLEYAALGHQGRRRFVASAHYYFYYPSATTIPEQAYTIPTDLLNPYERRLNMFYTPIWLRTCYNAGTDDIHASLLSSIPANNIFNPSEGCILSDAARYSFLSTQPLSSILAFTPLLTEIDCNLTSPLYPQPEEITPWSSRELQAQLQGDRVESFDTEEQRKHKRMFHQRSFFVADEEAMRTGYVLWVHIDQFGNVLQRNRAQPLLFEALGGRDGGVSLGDLGVGYENGRLDAERPVGQLEAEVGQTVV